MSHEIQDINLINVYSALSLSADEDFSFKNDSSFVNKIMETIYDEFMLKIDSHELENNVILLNNSFVKLIKFCKEKHNYKKTSIIFIIYCDYFDLEYAKVFKHLHDKLQTLIKIGAIEMIGDKVYQSYVKKKQNGVIITSLFDLIKK